MHNPAWWDRVVDEVRAAQREEPANLPGAVLAAETLADGPLITAIGDGWSADTICAMGTMTKPFIATAVLMALEDHGLCDIETEVWRPAGPGALRREPGQTRDPGSSRW